MSAHACPAPRPCLELADIFRRFGERYRKSHRLPLHQLRLMRAIEVCRTAALGGHVEQCRRCGLRRNSYNSCRNRHCPKCQNAARAAWVARRKAELLPVPCFHIVFTIPEQLNDLVRQNARVVYDILFRTSAQTLLSIAADPKHLGARIGFFSVLHTWSQTLLLHPHVHCVVAGGGLNADGTAWIHCRPNFLLSVHVLSRRFRRLFLDALEQAFHGGKLEFHGALEPLRNDLPQLISELRRREWVVYAKPSFGGPGQAIEYLGRYTHRVAISNQRLLDLTDQQVRFQFKDYRREGPQKMRQMTLDADEFIRRFLLHSMPPGFQRIRHYGLLSGRRKKQMLEVCRRLLEAPELPLPTAAEMAAYRLQVTAAVRACPNCGSEMICVELIAAIPYRTPPDTS